MTGFAAGAGAGLAWLGAAVLVLSDGRRGLAAGIAVAAVGLAAALAATSAAAAGLVLAGGLASALLRLRGGRPGWGLLPPGSTPRLILCVVAGAAALYLGILMAGSAGPPLAVAGLAAAGLATARLLGSDRRQDALACSALAALGLAALEATGAASAAIAAAGAAAVVAVLVSIPKAGGEGAA